MPPPPPLQPSWGLRRSPFHLKCYVSGSAYSATDDERLFHFTLIFTKLKHARYSGGGDNFGGAISSFAKLSHATAHLQINAT